MHCRTLLRCSGTLKCIFRLSAPLKRILRWHHSTLTAVGGCHGPSGPTWRFHGTSKRNFRSPCKSQAHCCSAAGVLPCLQV